MKWVLLVLLVLTIASFGLGWWTTGDSAEEEMGAAWFYGFGYAFGALLVLLVIGTVIWQAFV